VKFNVNTLILAGIILAGCSNPDIESFSDRDADIAALTKIKLEDWPRYYRENDADGLADFLSDEFVVISDTGRITPKADEVDWVRNNEWAGADTGFVYEIEKITFPTDDTAIIYGTGRSERINAAGQPCAHSYVSSNSLRRDGGRWRATLSHVSGVTCTVIE